ncbi:hypothetical protein BH09SUM1_BH09SUM1_26080 [soil metagenome]
MKTATLILAAAVACIAAAAPARTKLVTLPIRSQLVTSLENSRYTLLFEEREIPLQKGTNYVDFSWNGVSIDANSVMIEMMTNPGDGDTASKIIATGFPPNENALTWQVYSPEARTERIRVSYLLYGISQEASYEFRVNEKETGGDFQQYLLLRNNSGEDLDSSVLRIPGLDDLSRSVDSGEVRRFLALRNKELPVQKLYVSHPSYNDWKGEDGEIVSLVYEIKNVTDVGLGKSKLAAGKVRIYGDDGMSSSIFLGEDMLTETAPQENGDLTLGSVKDVVFRRRLMKNEQQNVRRDSGNTTVLFDSVRQYTYELENFKNEAVTLKIVEPMKGDWELNPSTTDGVKTERKSLNELVIYVDLPAAKKGEPAEKKNVELNFTIHNVFPNEQ